MIPILRDSTDYTTGRIYESNDTKSLNVGIGALAEATDCTVVEELNGQYELALKYPVNGEFAKKITPRQLILAKPNLIDDPQFFRVYKVQNDLQGLMTISARHISYDLSGYLVQAFNRANLTTAQQAIDLLISHCVTAPADFTITSANNSTIISSYGVSEPATLRSFMAGKEGSIIDRFGGEWYYYNLNAYHLPHRGEDNGVAIRWTANLQSLNKELTDESQYTHVFGFYKYNNGVTDTIIYGTPQITAGTSYPYTKMYLLDTSQHFGTDTIPTTAQIDSYVQSWIQSNKPAEMKQTLKVGMLTIRDLTERVSLGDTVHVIYKGEDITTRVRKTTWDVLRDRYSSITVGDGGETITQTIKNIK